MKREYKSMGFSILLILLNIGVMAGLVFTPLSGVLEYVFQYLILGVLFFGALLTGGVYIAKRGIRNDNRPLAGLGVIILQFAYGVFGAGILSLVPARLFPIILGITLVITTGIALLAGALVYLTGKDFSKWGMYANYIFLGVIGVSLFGTFLPAFEIIAFSLALLGFFVYLVYEIHILRNTDQNPYMNGVGIYVAFMGVFIEILQLVVRMYLEE